MPDLVMEQCYQSFHGIHIHAINSIYALIFTNNTEKQMLKTGNRKLYQQLGYQNYHLRSRVRPLDPRAETT